MRGLAWLLLVLGGVGVAFAPRRPTEPATGAEVYRRAVKGTAWVLAAGQGKGSGFVIDSARRHLVTCYHVVGENQTCEVVFLWQKSGRPVAQRRVYLEEMPELRKRG